MVAKPAEIHVIKIRSKPLRDDLKHNLNWPTPNQAFIQHPDALIRSIREDAPISSIGINSRGLEEFIVTGYDEVEEILKTDEVFSSEEVFRLRMPTPGEHVLALEPQTFASDEPRHSLKRKIIAPLFTDDRLAEAVPVIQQTTQELLDNIVHQGETDFVVDVATPLPILVFNRMLGLPDSDWPKFAKWASEIPALGRPYEQNDRLRQARFRFEVLEYMRAAVTERTTRRQRDGLSLVIESQIARDGEVDVSQVTREVTNLCLAGAVKSSYLLSSLILVLLQNPAAMKQVRADHPLVPLAVDECLRYSTPLMYSQRRSREETVVRGTRIPSGALVTVLFVGANWDPQQFTCPSAFRFDRETPHAHLAFGRGIHSCLGSRLARMEAEIVCTAVLERLGDLRLDGQRNDFEYYDTAYTRRLRHLYLQFAPSPQTGGRGT